MPGSSRRAQRPQVWARYIIWSHSAVRVSNETWRRRKPYPGEEIMTVNGLHSHLARWADESGIVRNVEGPDSYIAALAYERRPDATRRAALDYWRLLIEERE